MTTLLTRGGGGREIVYVDFLRPTLNHGIIANADDVQCNSVTKQKQIIIQDWQWSRWCMVETHISKYSTSFGKCQKFLKDNITAMSYSLWTTLRRFGINLPIRASVNLFISSFRPRLSQKKCIQFYDLFHAFEQRTPNQFCWGTPLFNVRLFIFRFHFFFIIIVIFMHPCFF